MLFIKFDANPLNAKRLFSIGEITLKPANGSFVNLSNKKHVENSKIETQGDSSDTKLLLYERNENQTCVGSEENLDNLIQSSRHLAHQLNNLLTTILANTQLMFLMVKDDELKQYLEYVEDATRNAGTVVREFQELVKATAKMSS